MYLFSQILPHCNSIQTMVQKLLRAKPQRKDHSRHKMASQHPSLSKASAIHT